MRRKRGSVGTRPGRRGLWLRWWDAAGKRHLRRAESDDPDEATAELKEILEDEDAGASVRHPTLDAFLADIYVPVYRSEVAASTFARSKPQIDRLSRELGSRLIRTITVTDIRTYVARLRETGLSPGTLRREVAVIRPVFEAAIQHGVARVNPVRVKLDAAPPRRPTLRTTKEVDAVLGSASALYRPYLTLLVDTGLRRTTCIELEWKDVAGDFSALLPSPRANAKRKIPALPLTRRAQSTLRAIRSAQSEDESRVFPALTENSVRLWWARFRKRKSAPAWLRTWRLHDWRHQFGSELAQRRVPFPVVADLLGHANARLVAEVYGTSSPTSAAADAIQALELGRRPVARARRKPSPGKRRRTRPRRR